MRDYKKEYKEFGGTEEQKKRRAQRNAERAKAMKAGLVKKGDGKEVHHLGDNRKGKLGTKVAVVSKRVNRSKQPKRDGSQD